MRKINRREAVDMALPIVYVITGVLTLLSLVFSWVEEEPTFLGAVGAVSLVVFLAMNALYLVFNFDIVIMKCWNFVATIVNAFNKNEEDTDEPGPL